MNGNQRLRQLAVIAAGLLYVMTGLAGCTGATRTSDQTLREVGYQQLKDMLPGTKKGPTVLVDVRSQARFDEGHIPGAVNIPLPKLMAGDPNLAEAQHVIVYAADWVDVLGPAAAKRLSALGYKNVYLFRGGLKLWHNEGTSDLPVATQLQDQI